MADNTQKLVRDALTEAARQVAIAKRILQTKAKDLDLSPNRAGEIMGSIRDAQVLLANAMDALANA